MLRWVTVSFPYQAKVFHYIMNIALSCNVATKFHFLILFID